MLMKELGEFKVPFVSEFHLEDLDRASIKHFWLKLISDVLGNPISIPVMVARGREDGPILGLTAAVHGNNSV